MKDKERSIELYTVYIQHSVHLCIYKTRVCVCVYVHSIMSHSLGPHGIQPASFLCPWNFPGKNTRVGCHFLLHIKHD